uniref:Protein CLEC16A n=1 Tax=Anthurium amnicola TaxID=1678845 RepID=A0A1D1YYN4_9ARAE
MRWRGTRGRSGDQCAEVSEQLRSRLRQGVCGSLSGDPETASPWTSSDYIFSNEHISHLIVHPFDFKNEELLSYYISFLRAISGKLNKSTIPLLVKAENDKVISFPLYTKAIEFSSDGESMVRIAVRALTLNVYHVGDEHVNTYICSAPLSDYFSDLVKRFLKQCTELNNLVSRAAENPESSDTTSNILAAVDRIEDDLYYFSDIISAGVPDMGRLITNNILELLVFPLLLPSLKEQPDVAQIGVITSLYLLCCILHIVKTKELASSIASALFFPMEAFISKFEAKPNGHACDLHITQEYGEQDADSLGTSLIKESSGVSVLSSSSFSQTSPRSDFCSKSNHCGPHASVRELLLSYVTTSDDVHVLGSLSLLATLLQTKELDESMLDGLGILPQRKQQKKLLLQALVGEGLGEEQLFSSENSLTKDSIDTELDGYIQKLKDHLGHFYCEESGASFQKHRYQVLDALVSLLCRVNISSEALWLGGWLLRQLLPHSEKEFNSHHLKLLKGSHKNSTAGLSEEMKGGWCDLLVTVITEEWKKCQKAIEAPTPQRDPKCILLPYQACLSEGDSSSVAGERMLEIVKVFVLRHQILIFSSGGTLPDQPPLNFPTSDHVQSRAKSAGLDVLVPKPGTEINLVDAIPCRIAFERGKERHFCFLAISSGTSGWVLLAEELPLNPRQGVTRVAAPLAGSNPRIDEKHPKWLHLRIRPSTFPSMDSKADVLGKGKRKVLVDGRWTLAFRDEQTCKSAMSMILDEMHMQRSEVGKMLNPLLDLDGSVHPVDSCFLPFEGQPAKPIDSL